METIYAGCSNATAWLNDFLYPLTTQNATSQSTKDRTVFQPLSLQKLDEEPRLKALSELTLAVSTSVQTFFVNVESQQVLDTMDRDWRSCLSISKGAAYFKSYGGRLRGVDVATGKVKFEIAAKDVSATYSLKACFGLPDGFVTVSSEGVRFWTDKGKHVQEIPLPQGELIDAHLLETYLYVLLKTKEGNLAVYGYKTTKYDEIHKWGCKLLEGKLEGEKGDRFFLTPSSVYRFSEQDQWVERYESGRDGQLAQKWHTSLTAPLSQSMGNSWAPISGNLTLEGKGEGHDFIAFDVTEGKQVKQTWILDIRTGSVDQRMSREFKCSGPGLVRVKEGKVDTFGTKWSFENNKPLRSDQLPSQNTIVRSELVGRWRVGVEKKMVPWFWGLIAYPEYTVGRFGVVRTKGELTPPPPRVLSQRRLVLLAAGVITALMLTRIMYRRLTRVKTITARPLPPPVDVPNPIEASPLPPPPPSELTTPPRQWYVMPLKRKSAFPSGPLTNPHYYLYRDFY